MTHAKEQDGRSGEPAESESPYGNQADYGGQGIAGSEEGHPDQPTPPEPASGAPDAR